MLLRNRVRRVTSFIMPYIHYSNRRNGHSPTRSRSIKKHIDRRRRHLALPIPALLGALWGTAPRKSSIPSGLPREFAGMVPPLPRIKRKAIGKPAPASRSQEEPMGSVSLNKLA